MTISPSVGVRGSHFFMSTPAYCLPCGTALGATWDMELIKEMGRKLLSEEAKRKAASVILAPTCNIPRVFLLLLSACALIYNLVPQNPLGGRVCQFSSILSGSSYRRLPVL